jgi:hypothetical protein
MSSVEKDRYSKTLEQAGEKIVLNQAMNEAAAQFESLLAEDSESLQKRADSCFDKYVRLSDVIGEDGVVVLDRDVEYPGLGKGNIVYRMMRYRNFGEPEDAEIQSVQNVFEFFATDRDEEEDPTTYPELAEVLPRLKVQGEGATPYGNLFYTFASTIPDMERSFDWIIESACDPELNPDLAEEAQKLRDSLQATA